MAIPHGANRAKRAGARATREVTTSRLMETLMRLGYIVRGLVYGAIGVLAFRVALGRGGTLTDPQGAIATLGRSALGGILLYGILVGLVGYALWSLIRAGFDPLHEGGGTKGVLQRVGHAVSGVSYLLLAYGTYSLIRGGRAAAAGTQSGQTQQATASILAKPGGVWAVGIVAVALTAAGLLQVYNGLRPDFKRQFEAYALSPGQRRWVHRLGRFGTAARGLVFTLTGVFLFLAAYRHNANQAKGIAGVLAALLQQPYGPWLLGIVALGLVAFGIYSAMSGLWLRFARR
jgi:hypothetical protein